MKYKISTLLNMPQNSKTLAIFKCVLLITCFFCLKSFCEKQTAGFTVLKITSSLAPNSQWEVPPLTPHDQQKLCSILSQKFYYLGSGGQCYAFLSEDKTTVIKFFKFHMRKTQRWFLPYLPTILKREFERKNAKAEKKLLRDFSSYQLAYNELKDETALLYVHLNKTSHLNQSIILVDLLGIAHRIELDSKEFIVQKKVELAYDYLQHLITINDLERAKRAIDSLLEVNINRCKKGIFDEDARLHRNFGFFISSNHWSSAEDKAIILDVGRLKKDSSRQNIEIYKKDLHQITKRFRLWLSEHCPELVPYLEQRLDEIG